MLIFSLCCAAKPGCRDEVKKQPMVVLQGAGEKSVTVRVEVAAREKERNLGLMYRRKLDPDAGMLFVYHSEAVHSFWMKNTYISLDLIFIGANKRVVGMIERTTPLSLESLKVDVPSRFILEVNAGFVDRHKIREGSRVVFEGIAQVQ